MSVLDQQRCRVIYCVVPRELAQRLHEPLRRFYADDPLVEVVVERRDGERRGGAERRSAVAATKKRRLERRRIRNLAGRRVGERRAPVLAVEAPELPRRARRYGAQLVFCKRLAPADVAAEDRDTARLVVRFQAGERAIFGELYARYFSRLYAHLKILLNDEHEAEDATQEVFMRALEALPRFELRGQTPFRAWLFRIARNWGLKQLRLSNRLEVEELAAIERRRANGGGEEDEGLAADVLGWITDPQITFLIEHMPLVQRQVITLRYLLGLGNTEIAEVLGRSPGAVNKIHARSIEFLEERLTSLGHRTAIAAATTATTKISPGMQRPRVQQRVLRNRRFAIGGG